MIACTICWRKKKNFFLKINSFNQKDVWLTGATAVEIRNLGLELLETYDQLAKGTFRRSRALHVFVPNHHLFQHVQYSLLAGQRQPWVLNSLICGFSPGKHAGLQDVFMQTPLLKG